MPDPSGASPDLEDLTDLLTLLHGICEDALAGILNVGPIQSPHPVPPSPGHTPGGAG